MHFALELRHLVLQDHNGVVLSLDLFGKELVLSIEVVVLTLHPHRLQAILLQLATHGNHSLVRRLFCFIVEHLEHSVGVFSPGDVGFVLFFHLLEHALHGDVSLFKLSFIV